MEELVAWILAGAAVLILLPFVFRWVLAGLYWFLVVLGWGSYFTLDQFFNAHFFPAAPWVMWMLGGALIGGALGFWTLAPIYGLRQYRRLIALAPFILLALVMIVRLWVSRGG